MPKTKGAGAGAAPQIASMNPDEFIQAGLADDFDGEIQEAVYVPWNYAGNLDHYTLGVELTILPDPDSGMDEFKQVYSAGDLRNWVPSEDRQEPVGLSVEDYAQMAAGTAEPEEEDLATMRGPHAIRVGKQANLPNSTNWAFFLKQLALAKYDNWDEGLPGLSGLRAHFNRIPPPKRGGLINTGADGEKRASDVLVVTEILEAAKGKAVKKTGTVQKASKTTEVEEEGGENTTGPDAGDDLSVTVGGWILAALSELEDGEGITKQEAAKVVQRSAKADGVKGKDLARALSLIQNPEFLGGSGMWEYDEDEGVLSMG